MRVTLSKKIVGPYILIAVLVAAMVATQFFITQRILNIANEETLLQETRINIGALANNVKNGILAHDDGFAVLAAQKALEAEETFDQLGPEAQEMYAEFIDYFAALVALNGIFLENRIDEGEKQLDKLNAMEKGIANDVQNRIDQTAAEHVQLTNLATTFQVIVLLVIILAMAATSLYVRRSVVVPVQRMRDLLRDISQGEGDLTARLTRTSNDEIGEIADAFNTMVGKLQQIIRTVAQSANDVMHRAETLANAMGQTSQATAEQNEAATAAATSAEQVTSSVAQVAELAGKSEKVSIEADQLAEEGRRQATSTSKRVAETAKAVKSAAEQVEALNARSEQIRSIVAVIRDIAEQTNLLALNAAIEAARAGEHGRGFAVVADEVRQLAERTASATEEIGSMIDAIGGDIEHTVGIMRESSEQQALSMQSVEALNEMLERISDAIRAAASRSRDIANATQREKTAAESMSKSVHQITQMSEKISAVVGDSNTSAQNLRELALRLTEEVGRFRV